MQPTFIQALDNSEWRNISHKCSRYCRPWRQSTFLFFFFFSFSHKLRAIWGKKIFLTIWLLFFSLPNIVNCEGKILIIDVSFIFSRIFPESVIHNGTLDEKIDTISSFVVKVITKIHFLIIQLSRLSWPKSVISINLYVKFKCSTSRSPGIFERIFLPTTRCNKNILYIVMWKEKSITLKTPWKKWFWKEIFLSVTDLSIPFVLSNKYSYNFYYLQFY